MTQKTLCPKCNKDMQLMERDNEKDYHYFVCHDCEYVIKKALCEVYSRVVGYLRPVSGWNLGKKQEFAQRKTYKIGSKCEK